jgi:uncharacterized metal-binding protein
LVTVRWLAPLRYLWVALWWPYAKLIPHRSFCSHGPLVGTAGRLLWLLLICPLQIGLGAGIGMAVLGMLAGEPTSPVEVLQLALEVRAVLSPPIRTPFWLAAALGLALSDAAHAVMDPRHLFRHRVRGRFSH